MEDEENRKTKQKNNKSGGALSQIQREVKKYKSMDDTQCLAFLEDLWVQKTETFSPKSDIMLYLQSELAHTYLRLRKFSRSQNLFHDLWEKQKEVLSENHPDTLRTEVLLGQTYFSLGQFDDAFIILQDALEKQCRILDEDHLDTLHTEILLGQTYLSLGRFDDAFIFLQDVLEKQRRILDEDHLDTLRTEALLGQTYLSLGQFDDALIVLQDVLEKQRHILDENHLDTLRTEALLGQTYLSLGQFDDALTVLQEVLEKQRRILGEDYSDTLRTEALLGQTYLSLGQFDDAFTVLQDVLGKQHRILGEDHPDTLRTEALFGQTYLSLGKFDDAFTVLQDALEKQRRILGEDHPDTLRTEALLGQIFLSLGKFDDAFTVLQDALEKQRRILGEDHPDTLRTEVLFGLSYVPRRQFAQASDVFQEALEKQLRILGESHPDTLATEASLGMTYLLLKQFDSAFAVLQDVLERLRRILGVSHPDTLSTEAFLGMTYLSRRQFDNAFTVLQDVLEKLRRILGKDHPNLLTIEVFLGLIYISRRQFDDAFTVFQDVLKRQRRILGEEHPSTLDTEVILGRSYISLGQFDNALTVLRDVLEKQRRILGKEHPSTLDTKRLITDISGDNFEDKQQSSSSDKNKYLEGVNFNIPIPDYGLISRFQRYDFNFSRSKIYSEQTGVQLINPSERDIPGFSRGKIQNNFEDVFLSIKNFLNLGDVQLNIKPIMCIYGKNQAGKSNISRLLYGFQHSSTKITEKLKEWRYSKRIRSLPNELNSLKSKLAEEGLSKAQRVRFNIPEEVYNLLAGRLQILIDEQISELPLFFYPSEKNWKNLIGILDNTDTCHIHSSKSSFNCDVKVNAGRDNPIIEINLKPKKSFKIEIELVYESNERDFIGSSIFESIYNLSALKIHFSGRQPVLIPLKKINLSDNLEHLPILHHVMHFSGISYISNQDTASLKYEEIPRIINNTKMVSKEELDVLDNRLVYLIYDTLLIELWKMSPFSFFAGDARFFPAERGGILERMQIYDVKDILQKERIPEGLRQYSRLIEDSLSFLEENKNKARSKLSILEQNLLKGIESDLINILYHLELKVSQDTDGASKHVFVKKTQGEEKENKREFVLNILPSSIFSLFALNLHIRLSKLKMILFYEEPETHLHPSSIEKLCELLVKIYHYIQSGEEHNLVMLFTTHSGFFLNFLFLALERKYGLSKMKEILSVIRLFTDESGGTKSEAIMITEEGYSGSPFDEEELKIYEELTRLYNKYTTD